MRTIYTPDQAAHECLNTSIIRLTFSCPCTKTDPAKARFRLITGKGRAVYQLESVKNKQAFQKSITPNDLLPTIAEYFTLFKKAECCGRQEKLFFLQNKKGIISLIKRISSAALSVPNGSSTHNKIKHYLIPEGTPLPFLIEQGVMNAEGTVLKQKYHKFRQINKFLEFITAIEPFIKDTVSRSEKPFSITDFGCGKAYLSFALYYYLHERKKLPVTLHGLDLKAEVIEHCSLLAQKYGYTDLSFEEGNIANHLLSDDTGMMVCLHACDTATDLALAQAIRKNVPIIFAIPCCQHEIYAQLKNRKAAFAEEEHLFFPFMEHGIITERFAALLTDTVRALLLQACGYTVDVMEFIEMEHTSKNILIRAVKKTHSQQQSEALQKTALRQYLSIKTSFRIEPTLEKLLDGCIKPIQNVHCRIDR